MKAGNINTNYIFILLVMHKKTNQTTFIYCKPTDELAAFRVLFFYDRSPLCDQTINETNVLMTFEVPNEDKKNLGVSE